MADHESPRAAKVLGLPAWHAARYQRLSEPRSNESCPNEPHPNGYRPASAFDRFAARVDAATPAHRDRAVDALRALAILGVVLGHWLITALTATGGGLRTVSPLAERPALTPVSWVLQTLAVFFLVGGYGAAKGLRPGVAPFAWAKQRLARLWRPVPLLLIVWVPAALALWLGGFPPGTVRTLVKLVLSPLWFLIVYGVLTALAPLVSVAWFRYRWRLPVAAVAATALVDVVRFGLDGPAWLGWATVLTGWLVPFSLGVAWAHGAFAGVRAAAFLLVGGALATVGLVLWAGYPASMVGVPGAEVSNLNPPTLAAVAFGLAQTGLALLLRGPLTRWTRRPRAWATVAAANLGAMTVFLWHQTAMMSVTVVLLLAAGPLPGLHDCPDDPGWPLARLLWLPAFALALALAGLAALAHGRRRSERS
ncbi:acyltransferase family protein [Actinomadura hibisca]|uniref:acyltransferase family protein n=1 Tax=Actinomadura hibisca TaxID=68565 RepID=UPI0009FCC276|nr:acyltransferase [Actinomadura hibisca]